MFLRHDRLLHEIIEYRMRGKPTKMRRRNQMLHDLANDGGYTALKWELRTEMVETQRRDVKNNCSTADFSNDDDVDSVQCRYHKLTTQRETEAS